MKYIILTEYCNYLPHGLEDNIWLTVVTAPGRMSLKFASFWAAVTVVEHG